MDTASELGGWFSILSLCDERQAGKLGISFFEVFWYDSTWGMNPRSTECETDAQNTTPSRRLFCKLFAGLGTANKLATSLLSSYLTLSSHPSFFLPQILWQELSSLFSCSIRLPLVPGHSFLPGNDAANELAGWGALLALPAIPCSLSPLISRIHSCLFTDWRHAVSSKFFDT